MRIAVLGTGVVGRTLAPALVELGHQVVVGTRDPDATRARDEWPADLALCAYDVVAEGADLVVKALNTVNCQVMVDPARVGDGGGTTMFLAGDDASARTVVRGLLADLGWRDIVEFEELSAARAMEMWLPLWIRLVGKLGTVDFNIAVVR